jgi:AcrR family transcriptional regulator
LDAAREVFIARSYPAATVDEIRQRAGVSRSSFYRHFPDKWAVGKLIFNALTPAIRNQWVELAALRNPKLPEIAMWLRGFIRLLEGQHAFITVLREIEAVEPESIAISLSVKDEILRILAEGNPAYERYGKRADSEERYFAELFLFQFDQFAYMLSVRGWGRKDEALIRAMARHLQAFLRSN